MKPSTEGPGLRTFLLTVAGLLKQWRVVVVIPFVCMVVTLVLVLVVHPEVSEAKGLAATVNALVSGASSFTTLTP